MIEVKSTGLVYRNPKPYLKSIHAWHPTIVPLGGGGMLAGFDLAEAISAANYRSWVALSNDGGRTWSEPRRLVPGHTEVTDFIRLSRLSDGTVLGVGQRKQPDLETQSWNPETYGCRPGEWFTIRSGDHGETWSGPEVFEPAITGQPWEHCHAALETADGRLLLPAGLVRTWGRPPSDFRKNLQSAGLWGSSGLPTIQSLGVPNRFEPSGANQGVSARFLMLQYFAPERPCLQFPVFLDIGFLTRHYGNVGFSKSSCNSSTDANDYIR